MSNVEKAQRILALVEGVNASLIYVERQKEKAIEELKHTKKKQYVQGKIDAYSLIASQLEGVVINFNLRASQNYFKTPEEK